jgi:peptidoglycan/LPS O-acetylase OafA/YrhL
MTPMSELPDQATKKHHFLYLDGLRGWASMVVVLYHFILAFYPALYSAQPEESHFPNLIDCTIATSPYSIFYNGHFCVCIFFCLSGFVLSYKYLKEGDPEVIISSAVKRYFRLLIPVLFSILLVFLLQKCSFFFHDAVADKTFSIRWLKGFWKTDHTLKQMLDNAFIQVFFNQDIAYNTVLWTMRTELLGSYLVFSLLALFSRLRHRFLIYGFIAVVFLKVFLFHYVGFLAGMIICDLYISKPKFLYWISKRGINGTLLAIGTFLGSCPSVITKKSIYAYFTLRGEYAPDFYHVAGSLFILTAFLGNRTIQNLFSSKWSLHLGRCSFSMYLLHVPVIGSIGCFLFLKTEGMGSYHQQVFFVFVVYLLVVLVSSYYMTKYVDKNGIRLSEYIYSKYFKQTQERFPN